MAAAGKLAGIWLDAQEWALGRLQSGGLRTNPAAAHLDTGERGEQAALFALRRRGYIIVARRWNSARMRGDIDLIGWDGPELCFIEVKTRTARDIRPAEAAVDDDKRTVLRRLAHAYLKSFPEKARRTIPVRFDVVSVYLLAGQPEFEMFPNAFSWD
jgi:putative endonuclease